jgi:membrane protease YdiL (CAAX protease family)
VENKNEAHEDIKSLEQNTKTDEEQDGPSKLRGYKLVCAKLGVAMCVYFLFRLLGGWIILQLGNFSGSMSEAVFSLLSFFILLIFVYVIPLFVTALLFNSFSNYKGKYRQLYAKPKRLARALGTFPGTFGFGHGVALLTMLIMYILMRNLSGYDYIEELLRPPVMESSTNFASILVMVFMMVVIAPLFEEVWVRGIMYDALRPYGVGMAIIISSLLFGFMHGNIYMLFYTTAYGFAFGYIRYATNSLFTVTILHAIVNSIGAGALIIASLVQITNEQNRIVNTFSWIYMLAFLVIIIIGIVIFLSKIPKIRKYRFENTWTEIGPWKKTALFFISIPVILMMVLVFNELSHGLLIGLIFR